MSEINDVTEGPYEANDALTEEVMAIVLLQKPDTLKLGQTMRKRISRQIPCQKHWIVDDSTISRLVYLNMYSHL